MSTSACATAEKLSQSLTQFKKASMELHKVVLNHCMPGCRMSEIGVLLMIRDATKPEGHEIKVSEISKLMHVTSPSVTQVLKGLEAHGLIERHVDPNDRRSVGITLTQRGEEVAERAKEAFMISFHGLVDYLGEEQSSQFALLLSKASRYFHEQISSISQPSWTGDEEV